MSEYRIIIVPPASPGSKGDEAMMLGALAVFGESAILISSPQEGPSWIEYLGLELKTGISEIRPISSAVTELRESDILFLLGADVIDGTCGLQPATERFNLIEAALARGLAVYVSCSFRSDVNPRIIEDITLLSNCTFLLRDSDSLNRFHSQTSLQGVPFPDLSFFLSEGRSKLIASVSEELSDLKRGNQLLIGLNFSEHAFRSFHDIHDDDHRTQFVCEILMELDAHLPGASYVLFSNDTRRFPNHISDDDFSTIAQTRIINTLGPNRVLQLPISANYVDNIALLRHVDFLVTGRMHLAYASFRAETPAMVIMGEGRGYSSSDKMRGGFKTHLGTDRWVVTSLNGVGTVAAELAANLPEARRQLLKFKQMLSDECAAARDTLRSRIKIDRLRDKNLHGIRLATMRGVLRSLEAEQTSLAERVLIGDQRIAELENERLFYSKRLGEVEMTLANATNRASDLEREVRAAKGREASARRIAQDHESSLASERSQAGEYRRSVLAALDNVAVAGHLIVEELASRRYGNRHDRATKGHEDWSHLVSHAYSQAGLNPLGWRVLDWGDRETEAGKAVNRQPDGSSAVWIRVSDIPTSESLSVAFASHPGRSAHREARDLLTSGIPDEIIRSPGLYPISLVNAEGRRFHVGVFRVREREGALLSLLKRLMPWLDEVPGGLQARMDSRPAPGDIEAPASKHRILVADDRLPRRSFSAGERATFEILSDLSNMGYDVVFLATDMRDDPDVRKALEGAGITVIGRSLLRSRAVDYILSEGHTFEAFYLIRLEVAEALLPAVRRAAPDARVIFHAPDLHFLRESRAAQISGRSSDMAAALETKRREIAIMRLADCAVVVSPVERDLVKELVPDGRFAVFPALYSPVADNPPDFEIRRHVAFIGGYGHAPNISAVRWFVEDIWPAVRSKLPDTEFHIIGAEAPQEVIELGKRPGVKFIGYVEDADSAISRYRLSVAPLLFGAGIKGKLGISMGAGTPCVTTTIGSEGMGILDGVHALVRDDAASFAAAVAELYGEKERWTRLSASGLQLVRESFGGHANRASLLRVLEDARALPHDLYARDCTQPTLSWPTGGPPKKSPEVSIIIDAHQDWDVTRACLNSVAVSSTFSTKVHEILLINLPPEQAEAASKGYPGVRVATAAAPISPDGQWLVFLNGSSIVMPNWLPSLLDTASRYPKASVIGSRIAGLNGSTLAAGGVIFSDGTLHMLGCGAEGGDPYFAFDREVDWLESGSIVLSRLFWNSTEAKRGLFELNDSDVLDLCMTARQLGHQVVYSARSVIVRQSRAGAGGGNDGSGNRSLAMGDDSRAKWSKALSEMHLPPGTDPLAAAAHAERQPPASAVERRQGGHLNILYFSPFPSHPSNHGNQATIQSFAKRFQRMGHGVHFALLESSLYGDADREAMRQAWDSLEIIQHSCKLWSDGSEIPFDGWYDETLGRKIRILCEKHQIDVVFCSYVFQSKLLECVPDHILKVIDTHDRMGDRYQMLRDNGQPVEFFSCTPEEEGAYLRRADIVAARRLEEANYFDRVTGRQMAIVLPHVEDARFQNREFGPLRKVGIVASANRINLIILHDFLAELGRRCGDNCPFEVVVAGQVKDMIPDLDREQQKVFRRPWLKMLGFVSDIADFYGRVDLVVSPVTMGTGINVKTVQAMAFGMPLLTTKVGIKGIETSELLHQHETLSSLVESLLRISRNAHELSRLADISVDRYVMFCNTADKSFIDMMNHRKILLS